MAAIWFWILCVAPYVGAWIETFCLFKQIEESFVAPYVGAWIETCLFLSTLRKIIKSHPTWVRGLKLFERNKERVFHVAPYVGAWIETFKGQVERHSQKVAPYVGAWIETNLHYASVEPVRSHPTWVRGLKPIINGWVEHFRMSHPTWVRGLKRETFECLLRGGYVAPYVGAWIETELSAFRSSIQMSHPTWVRGLKLYIRIVYK